MLIDKPYTPETLASRWGCSPEKIRKMCQRGELKFFRLGKLIRIPVIEVERYECLIHTSSSNTEENLRSQLVQDEIAFASRLVRRTAA